MKERLIKKILKELNEIQKTKETKVYVGETDDFSFKFDFEDEMFYCSLSFEDLTDVNIETFFSYHDTMMLSLEEDVMDQECVTYDTLEIVYEYILNVKEIII